MGMPFPSYVPYRGASRDIDLGIHNLAVGGRTLLGGAVDDDVSALQVNGNEIIANGGLNLGGPASDLSWYYGYYRVVAYGNVGMFARQAAITVGGTGGPTDDTNKYMIGRSFGTDDGQDFFFYNHTTALSFIQDNISPVDGQDVVSLNNRVLIGFGQIYYWHPLQEADDGVSALQVSGKATISDTLATQSRHAWDLGGYAATAPAAAGYVTVTIDGTSYKLLATPA
jgi:hypothetical protein